MAQRTRSREAGIRTLSAGFGDRVLSQEHFSVFGEPAVHREAAWGESNPPLRLSQSRVRNRYTTTREYWTRTPVGGFTEIAGVQMSEIRTRRGKGITGDM